jgi:pyruvate-formate lyase-activating enzyme
MAAVAGSKGHIAVCSNGNTNFSPRPSFQARVALHVLDGVLTPEEGAEEILARTKLREVGIDTNMVCNLRCKYCYLDDRLEEQGKLTADEWLQRLAPLAINGCKLFAFIGKEPLTDDTAITVLEGLNKLRGEDLNFRTGMVTNGTLLSRYLDRLLETDISYLDISLDGLPSVNDTWRGEGTGERVLKNLKLILSRGPQCDLFVTSVLHQGNFEHIVEFASALFDMGLKGFFTSPILKFTRNDQIEHWAIKPSDLEKTIDALLSLIDRLPKPSGHQVIIDLPYRYAWWLLAHGRIATDRIFEDTYEAPYSQPDATLPLFLKMNFLSLSYWRALRITHDGIPIENLDLAAHPSYRAGATHNICNSKKREPISVLQYLLAHSFHTQFLTAHSSILTKLESLFDRDIPTQLTQQIRSLRNASPSYA